MFLSEVCAGFARLGQGEVGEVTLWVISMWLLLTFAVEILWLAPGGLFLVCIVYMAKPTKSP